MSRAISLIGAVLLFVILLVTAQAAATAPAGSAEPRPAPLALATVVAPSHIQGTVTANNLNVREQPSATSKVIGVVRRGARVSIIGQKPGWLQITFRSAPSGQGWISAQYVRIDGGAAPGQTPASAGSAAGGVPAPKAISYEDPTFRWEWSGLDQMAGQDWYFDILFFKSNAQDPYAFMVGEPALAKHQGNAWRLDRTKRIDILCDSYWTVQIAKRVNGAFAGWVSPKSNRLPIGKACPAGGGGSGPAPTATPCQDCGG